MVAMPGRRREYGIRRADQLEALTSPVRSRLLDVAAQLGACSVAELGEALGRAPSTLYRHIAILEGVGLLRRVGERKAVKHEEALYRAPARAIRISDAVGTPRLRAALARLYDALLRGAARGVRRGLGAERGSRSGRFRRTVVIQTTGWLTPEERGRADALVGELVDLMHAGARRRDDDAEERTLEQTTLTLAFFPEREPRRRLTPASAPPSRAPSRPSSGSRSTR